MKSIFTEAVVEMNLKFMYAMTPIPASFRGALIESRKAAHRHGRAVNGRARAVRCAAGSVEGRFYESACWCR